MLDAESTDQDTQATDSAETPTDAPDAPAKKAPAKRATKKATAKKSTTKTTTKKAAAKKTSKQATAPESPESAETTATEGEGEAPAKKTARKTAAKKTSGKKAAAAKKTVSSEAEPETAPAMVAPLFQAPDPVRAPARSTSEPTRSKPEAKDEERQDGGPARPTESEDRSDDSEDDGSGRRRRRRGGRRRRKSGDTGADAQESKQAQQEKKSSEGQQKQADGDDSSTDNGSGNRRRRRRRRSGEDGDGAPDDPENTVTRVRKARSAEDEITALTGSTRLEAKKQRRREGREAGRRRAPIVSEAEFLARREAVDRVMVIRQRKDLTQIAVLEDKVLVEHYVSRESQTSLIGNVYLGRVQNVLPSMEAAFIDIGKGRNAVLYAGEVNWEALGAKDGKPRKIESVLKSGQPVLVQVTKDPVGHKGARLTSQVSLPGRFLVYVPDGTTSGISRKLPDTERNRLKTLLKEIVSDEAGVIVRTAAEGASEEELTRDVERLTARWEDIRGKVDKGGDKGGAPQLLYGEPDLTLKVVRDLFTEDFARLVVSGDDAWDMVDGYVEHVAPDLADRLERFEPDSDTGEDVFSAYRIDEQIAKGLDRKVWLPSGGSLIIDRTEAMTVIDVNTGKFTGAGGNLEETVTKNNLEAAEEIVRQLRLRDIGGIIVVDFIDMVLESNRDLVLRRMVECLGRDRTRHQVAEVTSLGLVQMTRKRIGTGLLEAFSEACDHCAGRGLLVHHEPVEPKQKADDEPRRGRRGGRNRVRSDGSSGNGTTPSPKDVAAVARPKEDGVIAEAAEEKAAPKQPTEQPTEQPAKTKADEPAKEAAEKQPAPEATRAEEVAPPEAEPSVAPEPSAEPEAPAEPELPPAEPAAPRLVTGVRRRSVARRPAGPPAGAAADGAAPDGPAAGPSSAGGAATDRGAPRSDTPSHDEASEPEPEPVAPAHVPIKKKGSRKR